MFARIQSLASRKIEVKGWKKPDAQHSTWRVDSAAIREFKTSPPV